VSTDVSEEHIASAFRVEKISLARNELEIRWQLLSRWFLVNLFFYPEYGGNMFLRNVG
jgi:hypothetical protein